MTEEKKEALVFIDNKGRQWFPRVTARVVRDFELRTGVGLFESVFGILSELNAEDVAKDKIQISYVQLFKMFKDMFGHMGNLLFLIYESCRDTKGKVKYITEDNVAKIEEISFDDFCGSITQKESGMAIVVALKSIMTFFPDLDEGKEGEGGKAKGPFDLGLGAMFSSLQGLPK